MGTGQRRTDTNHTAPFVLHRKNTTLDCPWPPPLGQEGWIKEVFGGTTGTYT